MQGKALTKTAGRWDDKAKRKAVRLYKKLGNLREVGRQLEIPYDTLGFWVNQEWWQQEILAAKREDTVALEEAATEIARKSTDVLRDRLDNGDFVLTKDGEVTRKPVGAKDAAVILGISLQHRKNLQEEPVRIAQLGVAERLLNLQQQFARMVGAKQIDGELIDSKDAEGISSKERERIEEPLTTEYVVESSESEAGPSGDVQVDHQEEKAAPIIETNATSN